MKKLLLALIALAIIAAVVVAVRLVGERDESDTVDSKDAAALVGDDGDDSSGVDEGLRPKAGTYTYTGSGRESVDVLGGSEHVLPDEVPMVVQLDSDADSCEWTSNVIFVKQHVEERSYCTTDAALVDRGFTREIEFFGQTQKTEYECDDAAERMRIDAAEGDTWEWTCTEGDKATSVYTATFVGKETLEIGGEDIETWHTTIKSKQTGDTVGGDTTEMWIAETGLPVRFSGDLKVKTKSVLGETNYQERFRYELTSLVPEAA